MWVQSFDYDMEVTLIAQNFNESGHSFAIIIDIWEAKKMWLLCLKDVVMTGFLTFFPGFKQNTYNTAPLVQNFVQKTNHICHPRPLQAWSLKFRQHQNVLPFVHFPSNPLSPNVPFHSACFTSMFSLHTVIVQVEPGFIGTRPPTGDPAGRQTQKTSWHWLFHPQRTPSEWRFTKVLSSIGFCPVKAC